MKCRVHEFKVSASELPEINVVVVAGHTDRDWMQEVEAEASLALVCHKCGESIELSGQGSLRVDVG